MGGALLVELALAETVQIVRSTGFLARAKVAATSVLSPDDRVLSAALAKVREKPRTAQDLVARLGKDQRDVLLGLFPRSTWPTLDRP